MDAEKVFAENLGLIDRIASFVCRRNRLQPADADDFRSHVREKLFEDDYAILRKFEGRSSLSTYLMTVIPRMFFQYRVQMWGKWRPSAEAKRLGETAILLERMLTRDGCSLQEAVQELTLSEKPHCTRAELEAMYLRLPKRQPRPVLVSEAASGDVPASASADDDLMRSEREQKARDVAAVVDLVIGECAPEEQVILQMRFWHARKVPEIAQMLHVDQKKLYKQIDRLLARIRTALQQNGIARDAIGDLIQHGDHNFTIAATAGWEERPTSPSDVMDGDMATGEGRLSK